MRLHLYLWKQVLKLRFHHVGSFGLAKNGFEKKRVFTNSLHRFDDQIHQQNQLAAFLCLLLLSMYILSESCTLGNATVAKKQTCIQPQTCIKCPSFIWIYHPFRAVRISMQCTWRIRHFVFEHFVCWLIVFAIHRVSFEGGDDHFECLDDHFGHGRPFFVHVAKKLHKLQMHNKKDTIMSASTAEMLPIRANH